MPKAPVKGTKQVLLELAIPLVDEAKAFAQQRGETFKEVVTEALRRHMTYPPPLKPPPEPPPPLPPPAPLPDSGTAAEPPAKKPASKGKSKK